MTKYAFPDHQESDFVQKRLQLYYIGILKWKYTILIAECSYLSNY